MGYGEQLLASQYTSDVDIARATAQVWREAVLENPKFQELPRVDVPSIEPFPGGRRVRRGDRVDVQISDDRVKEGT